MSGDEKARTSELVGKPRLANPQTSVLNALPPNTALLDGDGTIQTVNASWRRFALANGWRTPDAGVGLNYLAVCDAATGSHSEESAAAAEGIRRVLGGDLTDFAMEYPCHSADEQRWFRMLVAPLDGPGSGAAVMHVDITPLKRAELALRASEQQFSTAFQWAPIGVSLVSLDGRFIAVNRALCRLLGYDAAELVTKSVTDVTHPDDIDAELSQARRLFRGLATQFQMEKRYLPKVGPPVWALLSVTLLRSDQGEPVHFITQIQDLTEQREASKAQRIQAHMLDQIGQAVIATDLEGRVLFANRFAGELYGWQPREMLGHSIMEVTVTETTEAQARAIMAQLQRGEPWRGEFQVRTRDGREFLADVTNSHLLDEQGHLAGIVGVSTDISQRKQDEAIAARLAAIVENSDDAIMGMDLHGVITSWNRGAEKIYGYTAAEMVGRTMQPLIPAGAQDTEAELVARLLAGQSIDRLETQRMTKDRRILDVSVTLSPIRDAAGVVVGISKIARDITIQNRAIELLQASEARLAAAQTQARLGSWELDLATLTGTFSEEMCRLLYRDPEAGAPSFDEFRDSIHPDDRAIIDATQDAHLRGAGPLSIDYRTHPSLGPVRYLTASIHLVRDADGRPTRLNGTAIDITERKLEEARRLASERRFRRLVDSNAQGVLFFSRTGEITDANDAFLGLIGYSRDDLNAGRLSWVALTPPEFAPLDAKALVELRDHGVSKAFEKEYVRKDGSRVPILLGAALFEDNLDEGVAFVVDLTERKKLEKQFLRAQRMESIGTLAGGIAHDLNNVLAPILMSVELLKEMHQGPDNQSIVETLRLSAVRGSELVQQVLSFARGISGERIPVSVGHLMRDLVAMMRDTFPRSIDVQLTIDPDLWTVNGDATQLHQVVLNLAVNARDAMSQGGQLNVILENVVLDETFAAMNADAHVGPYVRIRVIDTGSGMAPEVRDRVFEPFYTTKELGKGTGLGLSTTLTIVKSHGGFIDLYSEVGKGTTFKVYLPANTTVESSDAVAVAQSHLPRGHGELVLVVDDEENVRDIAERTLVRYGYQVMRVSNGAEAVAAYAQHRSTISVVLTDMSMPVMDGPALIIALRSIEPSVKIIGSSGLSINSDVARATGAGLVYFIPKPYTARALLTTVRAALDGDAPV